MNNDTPSDAIIDRAVELWCRALQKPRYENGDNSPQGALGAMLATKVVNKKISKVPDYPAAIEKFRHILTGMLRDLRETQTAAGYGFYVSLRTDYGPSEILAEAGDAAGVPREAFSIKSSVWIGSNYVGASFGYGATEIYHYPLSNGRWLITALRGEDMPSIIEAVTNGQPPELTIEYTGADHD